jgi:hypothetical protein
MDLEDHITTEGKTKQNIYKLYERAAGIFLSFYDQYILSSLVLLPHILSRHIDGSKDVCNYYKCKGPVNGHSFIFLSTLSPTAVVACTLESSFCT